VIERHLDPSAYRATADTAKLVTSLTELGHTGFTSGEAARVFGSNLGGAAKMIEFMNEKGAKSVGVYGEAEGQHRGVGHRARADGAVR
jgi:hypothetical protein